MPVTEAVKVADLPALSDTDVGPTVTAIGFKDTVDVADLVESAALFAVTVTLCWLAMTVGAL